MFGVFAFYKHNVFFPPSRMGSMVSNLEFFQIMGGVISKSILGNLIHVSTAALILCCMAGLLFGFIAMAGLNESEIRRRFADQQNRQ